MGMRICFSRLHVQASCEAQLPQPKEVVLIWDIDETLIVFNSLLLGSWAVAYGKDSAAMQLLGERWEAAILNIADKHFFCTQIEEYDQTCTLDVAPFDDGAKLVGYDYLRDGFPQAAFTAAAQQALQGVGLKQSTAQHAQQHAAGVRPLAPTQQPQQDLAAAIAAGGLPAGGGHGCTAGSSVLQQQLAADEAAEPDAHGGTTGPLFDQVDTPAGPVAEEASGKAAYAARGAMSQGLTKDDLRKLAYRYRHVGMLYRFGLQSLGTVALRREWQALFEETDTVTDHWLTHAADLLVACTQQLSALLQSSQEQQQQRRQHSQQAEQEQELEGRVKRGQRPGTPDALSTVVGPGTSAGAGLSPVKQLLLRGDVKPQEEQQGGKAALEPGQQQQQQLKATHELKQCQLLQQVAAAQQQQKQVKEASTEAGPAQAQEVSGQSKGMVSSSAGISSVTQSTPAEAAAPAADAVSGAGTPPSGAQPPTAAAATAAAGPAAGSPSAPAVEVVHVAVTSGQLVPSLAKLLLFKLSGHFTPDRVYSSRQQGKACCFDKVRERWGQAACYVVIGDGFEEEGAARERSWPFLRVLLTDVMAYPAAHVLRLERDALGGYGLPLTQLTVEHIARAVLAGQASQG
ncbi:hypothetical protein N2152v2_008624 [Parachlorella kessleri]